MITLPVVERMKGVLSFAKHFSILTWKGSVFIKLIVPSVVLTISKYIIFSYGNEFLNIIQLLVALTSLCLSIELLKSGRHNFFDSFKTNKEISKFKFWLLNNPSKHVSDFHVDILFSNLVRLHKMNASYCQVGFAEMLLSLTNAIDSLAIFGAFYPLFLPPMVRSMFAYLYLMYPILYLVASLLIIKLLYYLVTSERNRMHSLSTAAHLITKAVRDQATCDNYMNNPSSNKSNHKNSKKVSILLSLLELQSRSTLLNVFESCLLLLNEPSDLMTINTTDTAMSAFTDEVLLLCTLSQSVLHYHVLLL